MDKKKFEIANQLNDAIEKLRRDSTNCKTMLENMHSFLTIRNGSIGFDIPQSQAETILIIAKNAIEKELEKAEKEFVSL